MGVRVPPGLPFSKAKSPDRRPFFPVMQVGSPHERHEAVVRGMANGSNIGLERQGPRFQMGEATTASQSLSTTPRSVCPHRQVTIERALVPKSPTRATHPCFCQVVTRILPIGIANAHNTPTVHVAEFVRATAMRLLRVCVAALPSFFPSGRSSGTSPWSLGSGFITIG